MDLVKHLKKVASSEIIEKVVRLVEEKTKD